MEAAIAERERERARSPTRRISSRGSTRPLINKRILESLIKVGAFDFGGEHRASLFNRIDQMLGDAAAHAEGAAQRARSACLTMPR